LRYIFNLIIRNFLQIGHKMFFVLTFMPKKIFLITIVVETFKLALQNFSMSVNLWILRGGEEGEEVVGWGHVIKDGFFIWTITTFWASLVLLETSNQLIGRSIKTWACISSFRQLINNSSNKVSDMPSVWMESLSKVEMNASTIPDCLSLVRRPK
jgi:hypothetical protein